MAKRKRKTVDVVIESTPFSFRGHPFVGLTEDELNTFHSQERVNLNAPIFCRDDEKRLVYGLVYSPDTEDTHGEMADAETIERAAHGFMESRMVGLQHEREAPAAIVESYIAQQDLTLGGQHVVKGSWVVAMRIDDDELWGRVKAGEYGGISMGGWATREGA